MDNSQTPNQPSPTNDKSQIHLLIAEDEDFLANVYQTKLSKEGYTVTLVRNGDDALKSARAVKPTLIILDLIMPVKDGFDTLKELKADPNLDAIPVLVMSNLGQEEDSKRALGLGALNYIIKSDVSLQDMLNIISQTIEATVQTPNNPPPAQNAHNQ